MNNLRSLYQEIPCSENDVQSVDLDPSFAWRFTSPNFPSTKGSIHQPCGQLNDFK